MLIIDYPHGDRMLRDGFTMRTALTATIYNQQLMNTQQPIWGMTKQQSKKGMNKQQSKKGMNKQQSKKGMNKQQPMRGRFGPPEVLTAEEREAYLAATDTFDFSKLEVKKWMDDHTMWMGKDETPIAFAHRVYKQLRLHLPYNTADGGPWICSQILKTGYGECCRHAIVGTSILRANRIPARTACALWAVDDKSKGAHCWGEFYAKGVGWVPYDTTIDGTNLQTDAHFGSKNAELLAGMVDFDWVIDAGPFGEQTVPGIDYLPAYWSKGDGNTDNPKVAMTERVRVLKRMR